jgi:glutamine amidotransferase-like uncharacterized protein
MAPMKSLVRIVLEAAAPYRVLIAALVVLTAAICIDRGDGSARGSGAAQNMRASATATAVASILLFSGKGTSPEDVLAIEAVLDNNHLSYATVSSAQLNAMSTAQLREYRLFIIPGGNFIQIANNLTFGTTVNLRSAIDHGLNYLGICAGGFFAGHLRGYNSLDLTGGVQFRFYDAGRGIGKAVVSVAVAGGPALEQYWEYGPQLSGWGSAIGKYPDGTPAIVEGWYGRGWVILAGTHPEAPQKWLRGLSVKTSGGSDHGYASDLVRAALQQTMLPHY